MEMHLLTSNIICCTYFLLHLSAIAIFLKGFFPMKTVLPGYSTLSDSCFSLLDHCCKDGDESVAKCFQEPAFGRLVIVLVDALRADFVLPKDVHNVYERSHQEAKGFTANAKMSFVHNLILEQQAVAFYAKASPPTVTLPRIKAMTTGAIPGFVDVILNLNSSSLLDDSFVTQFYRNGRNLVFYGDEIWLRLFPGHFVRSDGTTSFFVTDYTEVDGNVTRHLHSELKRDDWDVMILHYLGLDHIGHIAGPSSPLIGPKLQEMDDVVKMLHQTFVDQDKSKTLPTLLVLCGDHGMSDQGSHGGSTPSEIFTPVVFLSSLYQHGRGVPFRGQVINQIDLAATLSLVLGHPIPKNSFGILTMDVLGHLDLEKKLKAAFFNAQRLKDAHAAESPPNFELGMTHAQLNTVYDLHQKWIGMDRNSENSVNQGKLILAEYNKVLREMQDMLASSKSQYDLHAMSFGIFLLIVIFFTSLLHFWCNFTEISMENYQQLISCTFFCALAVLLHLFVCTRPNCSLFLCSGYALLLSILLLSLVLFLFLSVLFLSAYAWKILHLIGAFVNQVFILKRFRYLGLWPGVVLHSVSLLSSSFVEEEHQTWYFLTVTVLLASLGYFAFHYLASLSHHRQDAFGKNEYVVFDHLQNPCYFADRNVEELDPKEDYYCQLTDKFHSDTDEKLLESKDKNTSSAMKCSYFWLILSCLICAALCRVARSWNQTGDKWSHLSDIGDWLIRPDNKVILSAVCAFSLLVVCIATALKTRDTWIRICFSSGALGIYLYHSVTGSLLLPYLYHGTICQGITEARLIYLFVAILAFRTAFKIVWPCHERDKNDKKLSSQPTDSSNKILRNKASGAALSDDETLVVSFWTDVLIVWTLLMLLLTRAHNIPLVAVIVVQSSCLNLVLKGLRGILNASSLVLFYLWMGQASFYYQGNSNSLATINLAVGYTGLESYEPLIVGLQIVLATYSGPIFWILALMKSLSELQLDQSIMFRRKWCSYAASTFYFTTLLSHLIVLIPYLIGAFIQRYHLFVWTVFSPKLLYEGVHSIVCTVLVIFVMGVNRCIVCL